MTAAVRNEKWILDRCDEVGECWIWRQAMNGTGQPMSTWMVDGRRKSVLVRRLALSLTLGRWPLPSEYTVAICRNSQCCRPDHVKAGTRKQLMGMAKARGSLCAGKKRSALMKLVARKRGNCKLDRQKVADIRAMHAEIGNCREVARRMAAAGLRLCPTYIHKIVTYRAWADGVFT